MPKIKVTLQKIETFGWYKSFIFESRQEPDIGAKVTVLFRTSNSFGSTAPVIPYDEKDIGELFYLDEPERALPK